MPNEIISLNEVIMVTDDNIADILDILHSYADSTPEEKAEAEAKWYAMAQPITTA